MTRQTSVIIAVGAGGRAMLRTADSICRQQRAAADVLLVEEFQHPSPALVDSLVSRMGAAVVPPGARPGIALNEAARRGTGEYLVLLRAGLMLHESFIQRCESTFHADASIAAIAPAIALRTADGSGELRWMPDTQTVAAILSDTRSIPPGFAIRRSVWESVGGFDETLDGLVDYDFWLRFASDHQTVATLSEPLIIREMAERSSDDAADDRRHLELFRAVLERHADAIEKGMAAVLVSREIRFGQLRQAHRELLARRDADLGELDRLRAEAAHHRAYLSHHGHAGVDWGDLRRSDPLSRDWGYDRGQPVDRRYIDQFLALYSSDVQGAVLEVQEDDLTRAYGGPRVDESSILDIDPANRRATMLADLRAAPDIPSNRFDCIILTQTLHVIDDMAAALAECHRILKPGGVLLATVPAASRVCLEYGEEGDFWRATPAGARALFRFAFTPSHTSTTTFGNVLTNTAFLQGLSSSELTDAEFAAPDPYFPALTGIRARKTDAAARAAHRGVVLLYHRIDQRPDIHELGIPPDLFAQHLQWLRAECTLLRLDELLTTPPEELPPRPVALTFDDGYVDNLEVAAPLLQGTPAAFFLTTRWLNEPGEYWWDVLERILLDTADVPAVLRIAIGGRDETLATGDRDARLRAHWRLHEAMVHAAVGERDRLEACLRTWSGGGPPRVRPATADEARRLAALPGVAIGAHTINHVALPDQSPEARMEEVSQSRATLAGVIGRPVGLFAYPYGAIDRQSAAAVRESCRWGLSCDEGPLGEAFDAARVPRLGVKRWEVVELASRIERLLEPGRYSGPRAFTLAP
jgi:peptidoglycan/xylan/chitin deacetylase (PgdA/CDA1 family)/SAM-dependent methyltransferase